jgi:saccharopine dehydrogenase-like NADP-dependent oxidoreductase
LPDALICAAGRHAPAELPKGVDTFESLDVAAQENEWLPILEKQDIAVLALGPFSHLRESAHRICLKAGLHCVDINDCPQTSRLILGLDSEARRQNVAILTGMGLSPGLSTLLLTQVLRLLDGAADDAAVRLFAGGDEPAGLGATRAMIDLLGPNVGEIREGKEKIVSASDAGARSTYAFPTLADVVHVVHCNSAEPPLLEASTIASALLARVDYRIHFQGMPGVIVDLFRRYAFLRSGKTADRLAAVFNPFTTRRDEIREI